MSDVREYEPYGRSDIGDTCEFCRIVSDESLARVEYQDGEVIVIHNKLRWVPVMLLVMPKEHMSQEEMWQSPIMARIAEVGVEMGKVHCPGGFRLLSNFGHEAMQSQSHGHLHVLGGRHMGPYV